MDVVKGKWRKNVLSKTWDRWRSMPMASDKKESRVNGKALTKIKPCHYFTKKTSEDDRPRKKNQVTPEGCFTVYVGLEKQRFVVKTEFANHTLFKALLEDAEMEYGFNSEGPILLPCEVNLFCKVLAEMEFGDDEDGEVNNNISCGSPIRLCSTPVLRRRGSSNFAKGGSYRLFRSSSMIEMNQF